MTPAQRAKLFATIGDIWDPDIGEYIVYALMIARFGKDSTKLLNQDEIDWLLTWLEERKANVN